MILAKQAKLVEKMVTDNSPTILSAIGIVGTVATAYLTAKGTFKAAEILYVEDEKKRLNGEDPLTTTEIVKMVWKEYIPAGGSGAVTVAAIFCANRISSRRLAAMAVAYSITEKRFDEFKEKAYSKLTPAKQQAVRDEAAQERLDKNPPTQVIVTGTGDVICYDKPSDRYFKSNMEKIRKTENDINQEVVHGDLPVPVADFYRYLGLKPTTWSSEVGWTNEMLMDISFSTCMTEDKQPCIVIDYDSTPIRGSKRRLSEDEDI